MNRPEPPHDFMKMPAWLKDSLFYQIYPQSFLDTNGDGIGDIPGITAKLDYVQSLGCNAIWLNPVFESPFADAGYDVSDFYRVAPRYGTNEDLKELFAEAHRRGMRVVLDLVAGHTSVEHPWFIESQKHESNEFSDRYLWVEPVWKDAPAPLQVITGYGERNGKFVTNFFCCQPALNYGYADPRPEHPWEKPVNHPACRAMLDELRQVMKFWLTLGADGFRVDMAQSLIRGHDSRLRLAAIQELWQGMRAWFDSEYPEAVLVSEWSYPIHAIDAGFHIDFMIHFETVAYNSLFRNHREELITGLERGASFFDRRGDGDILPFLGHFLEHLEATRGRGYISIPTGNHDTPPRLADDRTDNEYRCALLFLLMLPGIPFIYYGDEIGLPHGHGLASKEGGYERTGVRTPMAWDESPNAGFSTADPAALYLPVESGEGPNVAAAERDQDSVLNFVRQLTAIRRAHRALGADGEFLPLFAEKNRYPFVFERGDGEERFWVAVNPSGEPARASWETGGTGASVLVGRDADLSVANGKAEVILGAGSFGLWKVR